MKMMRCLSCRSYTLRRDSCPRCGGSLTSPHPPKPPTDEKRLALIMSAKKQLGVEGTSGRD